MRWAMEKGGTIDRLRSRGGRKSWHPRVAALLIVLWTAAAAGQPNPRPQANVYPDFSNTADTLLRTAAGHAKVGQWSETVDLYQRVISQFGETVAPLPKDDEAAAGAE